MVNEHIVKQLTKEEQCRLVDVPGVVPREDVGAPDYFISHAWSNPFSHLVQCVCDHLSGALDTTKVWIDIAAVNQHPSEQQQDDLANLRNAIHMSKVRTEGCVHRLGFSPLWLLSLIATSAVAPGKDTYGQIGHIPRGHVREGAGH